MSVIYVCDGCGKKEDGETLRDGRPNKPHLWFARRDDDGEQHACSRGCIPKIADKTGKTSVVAPW